MKTIRRVHGERLAAMLKALRLNFSYATPEVIEEGIRRLGGVVVRRMARRVVAV